MAPASPKEQAVGPVRESERYAHVDLLRGLALFGVLLGNAFSGFSTSLFAWIASDQPPLIANFLEFRALSIFAFLFGVGTAMLAGRKGRAFLARRFAVLFLIGLVHICLIWNGDILASYAVTGFLLLPFIGLNPRVLFGVALASLLLLPRIIDVPFPSKDAIARHGAEALRVYGTGSWTGILQFRIDEAAHWVMPLWIGTIPLQLGLMLLGMAAWKTSVLRAPRDHRRTMLVMLAVGVVLAAADHFLDVGLLWPLSIVYASAILLWLPAKRLTWITALGRMALTNYLMQSIVMTLVFNSYGLGLMGKLSGREVLAIVVALYTAQGWWSHLWLKSHAFGPAEWVWRSFTYGERQRMRA